MAVSANNKKNTDREFIYSSIWWIAYLALFFTVIYLSTEVIFSYRIEYSYSSCQEKECKCLAKVISKKINFLDKIKILITKDNFETKEDFLYYIDFSDVFRCTIIAEITD